MNFFINKNNKEDTNPYIYVRRDIDDAFWCGWKEGKDCCKGALLEILKANQLYQENDQGDIILEYINKKVIKEIEKL
jgi:hypothetical protein